jgi:hypothetical protein
MNETKTLKKQKDEAFNNVVYLLGKDENGIKYWLEMPTWDCGWHWGAGYVETYKQNWAPSKARDIDSHRHFKGFVIGQQQKYNFEKKVFEDDKYTHHLNEVLTESVLSDKESWVLSELMNSIYTLKETAEFFGRGSSHITENPLNKELKDPKLTKRINEVLLPKLFKKVEELLSPDGTTQEYIIK